MENLRLDLDVMHFPAFPTVGIWNLGRVPGFVSPMTLAALVKSDLESTRSTAQLRRCRQSQPTRGVPFCAPHHHPPSRTKHTISTMESPPPVLFQIQHHKHLLPQIARIHVDSIERDGVCLSFLPPFHKDSSGVDPSVLRHWEDYATQTTQDKCCLILQLDNNGKVTGVVVLTTPWSQTGPFRAGVEKLIVGPEYRRRGIAKRLMEAVEREARRLNRTLLVSSCISVTQCPPLISVRRWAQQRASRPCRCIPNWAGLNTDVCQNMPFLHAQGSD